MGEVAAICISRAKGECKESIPAADFKVDHGIVGDAHAGPWHRQISLLPSESIARVREQIPDLADGAFAENIVTTGVPLAEVAIGDRFRCGDEIVLEVTQIGKECHEGCAIREITGDCIMPREGIFCRVIDGGHLETGASICRVK